MSLRIIKDHRILGKELKLFYNHPLSPGNPFILPHGTIIINNLIQFIRLKYKMYKYQEVITPQIFNKKLWIKSGHWENYKNEMYLINTLTCETAIDSNDSENNQDSIQEMALKPMNCPAHCLLFSSETRSYNDLPIRYADFTALHRNEASGALTGLTRVRKFHQDDGHIFCSMDQLESEISSTLDFIQNVYKFLNFNDFSIHLSTRPLKYIGTLQEWDIAQDSLKNALESKKIPFLIKEGDGAFYGPKIDIEVKDALGRSHQTATVQLDFQLPSRFDLNYVSQDGSLKRPVIIHRAILGSLERMLAILIEHYAGKFPFWLSPRQAIVISVVPEFNEYAKKISNILSFNGQNPSLLNMLNTSYNIETDTSDHTLVVGKKEQETMTVNVRKEGKSLGNLTLPELLELFAKN